MTVPVRTYIFAWWICDQRRNPQMCVPIWWEGVEVFHGVKPRIRVLVRGRPVISDDQFWDRLSQVINVHLEYSPAHSYPPTRYPMSPRIPEFEVKTVNLDDRPHPGIKIVSE